MSLYSVSILYPEDSPSYHDIADYVTAVAIPFAVLRAKSTLFKSHLPLDDQPVKPGTPSYELGGNPLAEHYSVMIEHQGDGFKSVLCGSRVYQGESASHQQSSRLSMYIVSCTPGITEKHSHPAVPSLSSSETASSISTVQRCLYSNCFIFSVLLFFYY